MSVELESSVEVQDLLVDVHFIFDSVFEFLEFWCVWFSSVEQDEANLRKGAFLNQVFDGITSVVKMAVCSCVSDCRLTASSNRVAWVITKQIALSVQSLNVQVLATIATS